jgi:hypothetical protein
VNEPPRAPWPVLPKPGDVLKIHEDNYCYGQGELVLRVTAIREVVELADGDWLTVLDVQIGWNGADVCQREVLVRLSSLVPRRRRP